MTRPNRPKRRPLPDGKPEVIMVNGEQYEATVFLVNTRDVSTGVPRLCTMMLDDTVIELSGGEEFMVGYVPVKMKRKS